MLTHSTPHRAQTVETAPQAVQFDFNEPVEASFGAVRVYDEEGERVDDGEITRPDGASTKVAVGLRGGLGDGVYTGTYRVVSADGHPVSGGFSFGVGEALPTGGSAPSVADLLEESDAGAEVEGTYGLVRGLHYGALLFLIGAFAMAAVVWPRAGLGVTWPRRWVIGAAAVGSSARCSRSGCRAPWAPASGSATRSTARSSTGRSTRARARRGRSGRPPGWSC